MAAGRTRPTGVVRRYGNEPSSVPRQLVVQLAAELKPALIEDGFVQARLGLNVLAGPLDIAGRRPGHILHLQVLDTHHRVVLADRGRGLVQVVAADIADLLVELRDFGFRLLPVVAEPGFAAHGLLRLA